jgi:cytochrome c-type biogenesis protein CcmH/NrfF
MTLQTLSFFIMPVGALLIGLIVVYQAHWEAQLNRRK